jgi:serine/threonine protein phosphatase PrpC
MTEVIKYISSSKKGLSRDKNQDRILAIEHDYYYLFALFDGVSSLPMSYLFAEKFKKIIEGKIDLIDNQGNNLDKLFYEVNKEVVDLGIYGKSTISALFYSKLNDIVKYINIGDTRIYVFNNQFLEKITVDDSLEGSANVLTKCLGSKSLTIKDFELKEINNQYNFLLCTDGFYKLMEDNLKEYFNVLHYRKFPNIKRKIANLQKGKNRDDSSYILIKNEISNRS